MFETYIDNLFHMSLAIEQSEECGTVIEIGMYLMNIFMHGRLESTVVSGGATRTRSMVKKARESNALTEPKNNRLDANSHIVTYTIRSRRLFYILMALLWIQLFLSSSKQSRFQRNLDLIIISATFEAFSRLPAPSFIPMLPSQQHQLMLTLTTSILDSLMFSMLSIYIHKSSKDTEKASNITTLTLPAPIMWKNSLVLPAYKQMTPSEIERIYQNYITWTMKGMESFQETVSALLRKMHPDACVSAPYTYGRDLVSCRGDRCFKYLQKCVKDPSKRVSFIPIRFKYDQKDSFGHAAIILINHLKNEIELYDPNGLMSDHSEDYHSFISTVMKVAEVNDYAFVGQVTFGFQLLDMLYDGRFSGMCFMYSVWYMDVRLLNLDKSPKQIDALLLDFVATQPWVIYGYLAERMHHYYIADRYYQDFNSEYFDEPTTSKGHKDVLRLLKNELRSKYSRVHQNALKRLAESSDDLLSSLAREISNGTVHLRNRERA